MLYPLACDSARKKTEYLYKAQEELRILHNDFSKRLHEGKLSDAEFEIFKKEVFTPKSNAICQEICVQRAMLKNSSWTVNLEEI